MKYTFLTFALFICFTINSYAEMTKPRILVFVSFSMPKQSLINFMQDANIVSAPLILRGLVNNSFKETGKDISAIIAGTDNNKGDMQIDPTLFTCYKIEKVPAIVVLKNDGLSKCVLDYDVIYGNVTLEYALNEIAKQHDELAPIATSALEKLKEAHHV